MIPNSQLDTWANVGATSSPKRTREAIERTLTSDSSPLTQKGIRPKVYLQGSYKNTTNIYSDSDVDIVVRLDSTFYPDLSNLPPDQKQAAKNEQSDASYSWRDFRSDVISTLEAQYRVKKGSKALEVSGTSLPLTADVVVCLQYRLYTRFNAPSDSDYISGIVFWTKLGKNKIINFPTRHYDNGTTKHQNTYNRYKETVRIFKNARSYLDEKGQIDKDLAPSYFIECMLYNVPDAKYVSDYQTRYQNIVNHLEKSNLSGFECQNGIQDLFGSSSTQWSQSDATRFIDKLDLLWQNWYNW